MEEKKEEEEEEEEGGGGGGGKRRAGGVYIMVAVQIKDDLSQLLCFKQCARKMSDKV